MQRFKQLTTDARLLVLVTQHETQEQKLNIGRRVLPTLQAAVLSSRWVCMAFSESCLKTYTLLPHSLGLPSTPMVPYSFHEHLSVSHKWQPLAHYAEHECHCLCVLQSRRYHSVGSWTGA